MNLREMFDTIEAKVGLLECQQADGDRAAIHREIESELEEIREAMGWSSDIPECSGCGGEPLHRCLDCGCDYGTCCGSECEVGFLCGTCQDERCSDTDDGSEGLDVPPGKKTIALPPPGPDQAAIMRSLLSETGNVEGYGLLDEYEQGITAAGGWEYEAAKSVRPSRRLFDAVVGR